MPAPTAEQLKPLVEYVRNLVGDASSDGCDCGREISDNQIIMALEDTREMVRYENSCNVPTYGVSGQISYTIHKYEGFLADNAVLLDASYVPLEDTEITYSNPLRGEFETATSRLTVYLTGARYDPYEASAQVLRALRVKKRGLVDQSEMGVSIKLSQALSVMESVEKSYRQSARIRSVSFSRSDIA